MSENSAVQDANLAAALKELTKVLSALTEELELEVEQPGNTILPSPTAEPGSVPQPAQHSSPLLSSSNDPRGPEQRDGGQPSRLAQLSTGISTSDVFETAVDTNGGFLFPDESPFCLGTISSQKAQDLMRKKVIDFMGDGKVEFCKSRDRLVCRNGETTVAVRAPPIPDPFFSRLLRMGFLRQKHYDAERFRRHMGQNLFAGWEEAVLSEFAATSSSLMERLNDAFPVDIYIRLASLTYDCSGQIHNALSGREDIGGLSGLWPPSYLELRDGFGYQKSLSHGQLWILGDQRVTNQLPFDLVSMIFDAYSTPEEFDLSDQAFWHISDHTGSDDRCHCSQMPFRLSGDASEVTFRFSLFGSRISTFDLQIEGLEKQRIKGQLLNSNGRLRVDFVEVRASVWCLIFRSKSVRRLPAFKIVVLDDNLLSLGAFAKPEKCGFAVRGPATPLHMFQLTVYELLRAWDICWSNLLDEVDGLIQVKVGDIASDDRLTRLMIDDSLQRSKVYFAALQALRIFRDKINEMRTCLDGARRDFSRAFSVFLLLSNEEFERRSESEAKTALGQSFTDLQENWSIISDFHTKHEKALLDRIAAKMNEIKSLQDGLYNATAVREASRSTQMNRYVVVFTIVTVLYLPPSFIATVFGTDLFNDHNPVRKFKVATVAVSLGTYVLAFVLLLVAHRMGAIRRWLARLVSGLWGLCLGLPKQFSWPKRWTVFGPTRDSSSSSWSSD
ncbi:hypothetical protein VTK73DRAFT_6151 [Phialemonium thermophilum]|uniref:Uncharacterized protein n=1 Tax=Phialemonium thermophilum TaxID=223376 RepID=A0ABR3WKI6_9PEZI